MKQEVSFTFASARICRETSKTLFCWPGTGRACTSSWMSTRGCSRRFRKISGAPGTSKERSRVYWMLSCSGGTGIPFGAPAPPWGGMGEEGAGLSDMGFRFATLCGAR